MNSESEFPSQRPLRVAVIGGGCAALTAAFELTRPEHLGRYQVTVYQMGWRLGGKGASGRNPAGRIEEHGLHLWMGFYENAFRLMRECYAERRSAYPGCRFGDWRDAFRPAPDIGVADRNSDGWSFWLAHFPAGEGEPGDSAEKGSFSVLAYLQRSLTLLTELLRSAAQMESKTEPDSQGQFAGWDRVAGLRPETLTSAAELLFRYGQLATSAALLEATAILREVSEKFYSQMFREHMDVPLRILDGIAVAARRRMEALISQNGELRRVWQVIDLILAILRGSVRAGLAFHPDGFDAINDHDWRDWLRMNGAAQESLDSGFMRGIYDLVFAFQDGDANRPSLAAGVALRGAMRMFFTYRGSLFWRMSAGMGDVVFAPLYQVLKKRGVRFEFFHRLRNVGLAPAGEEPAYVQSLEFDRQARIRGGGEYQPLIDFRGVPSWPSRPNYSQLIDGGAIEREGRAFEASWEERRSGSKTLRVSRDFDFVVLGVGIGALPDVARELIAREQRWREMVANVKTVPTQAFQIWLRREMRDLGWKHPPVNVAGFVKPFDTWADMSHLIPEEDWNGDVKAIAYFCSVLPDARNNGAGVTQQLQRQQHDLVRANAVQFLNKDVKQLWSQATNEAGGFCWEALAQQREGEHDCAGEARFCSQFWTANINPSDRYVQSLPGSLEYRISPLDMTFDNLTIAGDWTATGLDSGCIESAVISGRLAAHAISQKPALEDIVGYDHP